jgi:hypothetical protein
MLAVFVLPLYELVKVAVPPQWPKFPKLTFTDSFTVTLQDVVGILCVTVCVLAVVPVVRVIPMLLLFPNQVSLLNSGEILLSATPLYVLGIVKLTTNECDFTELVIVVDVDATSQEIPLSDNASSPFNA